MDGDLEHAHASWNGAWLAKDVAAVEQMAADDYQYIGPYGQVLDRSTILEMIRSSSYRLGSGSWTEVSIGRVADDCAIALDRFRGAGEYCGRMFREDQRHTTVWVRRRGR